MEKKTKKIMKLNFFKRSMLNYEMEKISKKKTDVNPCKLINLMYAIWSKASNTENPWRPILNKLNIKWWNK